MPRNDQCLALLRLLLLLLKYCFNSTQTVGLLGTGAQDVHLDFHTAPELCLLRRVVEAFNRHGNGDRVLDYHVVAN